MSESGPTQNLEKTRKQKMESAKKALRKAGERFEKGEEGLYEKITTFASKFRGEHPDADKYVLLHCLIGSSLRPGEQESGLLDTNDGEIETFVEEILKE